MIDFPGEVPFVWRTRKHCFPNTAPHECRVVEGAAVTLASCFHANRKVCHSSFSSSSNCHVPNRIAELYD